MRIDSTPRITPTPVASDSVAQGVSPSADRAGPVIDTAQAAASAVQRPELDSAVEKMNQALHIFNQALQFEVADGNRIIVRVIDTASGEVIRQIPPEQLLDTYHRLEDALGVLIDRRV